MTKRSLWGWVFVMPFLIGFLFFILSPLYTSYMLSIYDQGKDAQNNPTLTYRGIKNYTDIATGGQLNYVTKLGQTFAQGLQVVFILIFSFMVANVLNQNFKGRTLARAIFFLPVITASGAASAMTAGWGTQYVRSDMAGSMQQLTIIDQIENAVKSLNLGGISSVISDAFTQLNQIVLLSGVQILIFLAALQTISPSLFEASDIEGASKWEAFWKITFPMVSPMILVSFMYTMIDYFTNRSNPVMSYLFFDTYNMQLSTKLAMGWVYFIVSTGFIFLLSGIMSKFVYYENHT